MTSFWVALLISLGAYVLVFIVPILCKVIFKKTNFVSLIKKWNNLYDFGLFLILDLTILLFVFLSYSRTTYLSVISIGVFLASTTRFVPLDSLIKKIIKHEWKEIKWFNFAGHVGVIVLLLIETFAFNNLSNKKDSNYIDASPISEIVKETNATKEDGYLVFKEQRQYFVIDNHDHLIESIKFDFESDVETKLQLDIYPMRNGIHTYEKDYKFNPEFEEFEYFNLSDQSDADSVLFIVVIDETNLGDISEISPVKLKQIHINQAFPFVFNPLRFIVLGSLFVGLILILRKGKEIVLTSTKNISLVQKIILLLSGVGLIILIVNSIIFAGNHYIDPSGLNEPGMAIYHQLFDALRKGQIHLDIPVNEQLLALENPYEPSARAGIPFLWDRALYGGKYYCYYGIVPVLLVMFPIYLLSGFTAVPSMQLMLEIGTLFSIVTFLLALTEMVKVFFKKINYPLFLFALVGAVFSSLLLSNAITKIGTFDEGIYRIPYAYGLGFLFLTYYLVFKSIKNSKWRMWKLGFAGLSVVFLMGSRPTLFIVLIPLIPILVKIVIEKKAWKKRVLELVPMFSVLIVGAVLICVYNKVRFNSIFEFGQTYQLTVTDNTKLKYSSKAIIPTLMQSFLLPFEINGTAFPYINYGYTDSLVGSYHVYNAGSMGISMLPMTWGLFAIPFVFKKRENIWLRISFYISPFVLFFLAFTTNCFAGVCPRYVVEIASIGVFFAFIPLMKVVESLMKKKTRTTLIVFAILVLVSTTVGFNLLFTNFDGWNEGSHHGILEIIRSIFNNYNINTYV